MAKKKNKEEKNQIQNQENNIDEIVDDIYEDETEAPSLIQKPVYQHSSRLLYVVLVLVVGFLAGVLGELTINNYLYHQGYDFTRWWEPAAVNEEGQQVIVFKKEEVANNSADQVKTLIDNASQAVVGIYLKRGGAQLVDVLYQPKDKIGNALVLTTDGWLVSTLTSLPKESGKELVVITADLKVYPIEKIVNDGTSGVVFLKIYADNLKVVKFAENSRLYSGLPVVALAESLASESVQSQVTAIEKVRYRHILGFADYFQSSEKYETFYTLKDKLPKDFVGGPVVDMEGGIIGLYAAEHDLPTIIPASHFANVFNNLLRSQEIERPYFGVNYVDLAIVVGLPEQISEKLTQGALVFGDREHNVIAVEARSPAAKAGIKLGDIILQVNNEPVDARHSLTELLQQYQVGDVVKLVVQNQGVVREVEVGLVSAPTP